MAADSDKLELSVSGQQLLVSSPDKVYFKTHGETKMDLIDYYEAVSEPLLLALGDRPLLMQRFPNGASGKSFFQKRVPKTAPDWLQTTTVSTPNGTESNALVAKDLAHIIWAVNLGCLGFHAWPTTAANPEIADELRIDLDPVSRQSFDDVRNAAHLTHQLLDELNIASYPKTTGSKGIHIYCRLQPKWDSYQVRAAAVALARELERRHPKLLTAQWWKEERGQRVFIDFNQNAPHKTVFAAWCVRPRVAGQVSTPFAWDELADIDPDALNIRSVPERLDKNGDPWKDAGKNLATIQPLLEMSAADMASGLMDAPWPPQYPKQPNEPPRVQPSRAKN